MSANISAVATDVEFDTRAFRRCLGQFATGVTVMTTGSATPIGITVNSFSSLSLDPPLVMWAVGKTSRSFAYFQTAEAFAVNVLASDQISISQRFSSSDSDKFKGIAWEAGLQGMPLIRGAVAQFQCLTEAIHDGGDHILLIGRVVKFETLDREALLFSQGQYGVRADHPEFVAKNVATTSNTEHEQRPFLSLVSDLYHRLTEKFEAHRNSEGLTSAQSRILGALARTESASVGSLAKSNYLGELETRDTVAELQRQGLISTGADGSLTLTQMGQNKRHAMSLRASTFEAEIANGISGSDLGALKDILAKIARTS